MPANTHNFTGNLAVITSLRDREIAASVAELRRMDETAMALRDALRMGIGIDDLSEASGLTPAEITRRVNRPLMVLSDLESMAGAA
jgi:hypothetical protein